MDCGMRDPFAGPFRRTGPAIFNPPNPFGAIRRFALDRCCRVNMLPAVTSSRFLILAALCVCMPSARAAFGLKDDGNTFTIDCESNPAVIVQVNKTNGNLQSIRVNGTELQKNPRGSHINSGFGKAAVTEEKVSKEDLLKEDDMPEGYGG